MEAARALFEEKIRVRFQRPRTRDYGGYFGYSNMTKSIEGLIYNDPSSRIALQINTPSHYVASKDVAVNLAVTMWESRDFPQSYIPGIRQADGVIVPSTYCKKIFELVCDAPVYVMPLGVGPEFGYVPRRQPTEKFRWLWLNAPDPRKGYHLMARIWEANFFNKSDVEIYFKTSGNKDPKVERIGNVTFDSRVLPKDELIALYQSAHGFVYPTLGEGFGLTLAEAMATGLPCVATGYTGHMDFLNHGTGFPCRYDFKRLKVNTDQFEVSIADDGMFEVAMPDAQSIATNMVAVMKQYKKALERGRRGSRLIKEKFSIEAMRGALAHIVAGYAGQER